MRRFRFSPHKFMLVFLLWPLACTPPKHSDSSLHTAADSFDSKPMASSDPIVSQLKRYRGQTEFVSMATRHWFDGRVYLSKEQGAGTNRVIQESDLFKLGEPGSHLLYVLNEYRGLQVIDFAQGPHQARLLSRTPLTADDVREMYLTPDFRHIVVLGQRWTGGYGGHPQGLLSVYSLQDPQHPKRMMELEIEGEIADSRMLGDVLYVAAARWDIQGAETTGSAWVSSYRIRAEGLELIQSQSLALPVVALDRMNIVESQVDGQLKYYLIAILDRNLWMGRDRQSSVEVIDISDPEGRIVPVMIVTAKGEIRERSATHVQKGTLLIVSNAWEKSAEGRQLRKVSVESFRLPAGTDCLLGPEEARFRQMWWEREMARKPDSADAEIYGQALDRDPQYGLQGCWVRDEKQRLAKVRSDAVVTVGDASGLHAELQDVRFLDDRLYVFWVPANQIDPLDVFDISQPAKEIRYLGRTLFTGWMERAIPLHFRGRTFILGLGWIAPDSGGGARRAQAILFELDQDSQGTSGAVTIGDQLILDKPQLWAYFNDQDKAIQMRMQNESEGLILFPAYIEGEHHGSGGQVISFDLKAEPGQQLQEGAFLLADASWLRRVFHNPAIDRIHTLTDRTLATFEVGLGGLTVADRFLAAVSSLELARDVVAYTQIEVDAREYGLQFIVHSSSEETEVQTEIRLVPADRADTEKAGILRQAACEGRFESFLLSPEGELFVLTTQTLRSDGRDGWQQRFRAYRLRFRASSDLLPEFELVETSWVRAKGTHRWEPFGRPYLDHQASAPRMLRLDSERILVVDGRQARLLTSKGEEFTSRELDLSSSCLPSSSEEFEILELGGTLMASYAVPVPAEKSHLADLRVVKRFLVPIDRATLHMKCQAAMNIPGRPLTLQGSQLVTREDRFLGFIEAMPPDRERSEAQVTNRYPQLVPVLYTLRLQGSRAFLADIYSLESALSDVRVASVGMILTERAHDWDPSLLVRLQVDETSRFVRKSFVIPGVQGPSDVHIVSVLQPDEGRILYLIGRENRGRLLEEQGDRLQTRAVQLLSVPDAPIRVEEFPLYYWFSSMETGSKRVDFDSRHQRLMLAEGLWGVIQARIL